jgi:2-methoxy-6-polyprenyl-1,4-benzoquinol methylase
MAPRSSIWPLIRATKPRFQSATISRTFSDTVRRAESPAQPTNHERTTHFGFETVAEAEKEARGITTLYTVPRTRS